MVGLRFLVALLLVSSGGLVQASPREPKAELQATPPTAQGEKKPPLKKSPPSYRADPSGMGVEVPERYHLSTAEHLRMREQLREQFHWIRAEAP